MNKKTQKDQVVEAMLNSGGYSTLGHLNQIIDFSSWKTKTPDATVRRIVQENDEFFKIQPGLWALTECKRDVEKIFALDESKQKQDDFSHSYFQGILTLLGNLKQFNTFIPRQDKNKLFLEKKLDDICTIKEMYNFSYPDLVDRAKTVDVIWFNDRNMPYAFFEVEHTTDISHSLIKFNELQDFYARFHIVADAYREKQFKKIISGITFNKIKNRVSFLSYEKIVKTYEKLSVLSEFSV